MSTERMMSYISSGAGMVGAGVAGFSFVHHSNKIEEVRGELKGDINNHAVLTNASLKTIISKTSANERKVDELLARIQILERMLKKKKNEPPKKQGRRLSSHDDKRSRRIEEETDSIPLPPTRERETLTRERVKEVPKLEVPTLQRDEEEEDDLIVSATEEDDEIQSESDNEEEAELEAIRMASNAR